MPFDSGSKRRDPHVTIAANLFALLWNQVRGSSCRVSLADNADTLCNCGVCNIRESELKKQVRLSILTM